MSAHVLLPLTVNSKSKQIELKVTLLLLVHIIYEINIWKFKVIFFFAQDYLKSILREYRVNK
jgi:hypothetical protein